jgi:lipopolysaccharide transport system ATP-binding protein
MNPMSSQNGIRLEKVTVDYPLYDSNAQVMQRRLVNLASFGRFQANLGNIKIIHALKGVSFDLTPGSAVGLIGRNGAGKSTLLKVMAGILEPSDGTIRRRGSITSLLTIGSGMELELDGYQNIRRIGLLRGFTLEEIDAVTEEIVEFAQLGDFISLPMRTYSSGMRMRLGFSIATVGTPDILLIDEVFAAGDSLFMQRARQRISRLLERSKSLVFSSHSAGLVREFCATCIYLQHGEIRAYGKTEEVLERYQADLERMRREYADPN